MDNFRHSNAGDFLHVRMRQANKAKLLTRLIIKEAKT